MNLTPKTIQIFLPTGDPRGIRIAEITTRIVQVIEVPRSQLQAFFKMSESMQVALYFLFGESEDGEEDQVYIGQTGDLKARLIDHNKNKDFWQRALILISRANTLTQTHALFLEWQSILKAREIGRFADMNGNAGSRPHTPAPMEAECLEFFETGQTLLSTLGYPIFDPLLERVEDIEKLPLICDSRGADGRGEYTEDGLVVAKGSYGPRDLTKSAQGGYIDRHREKLLQQGVLRIEDDRVMFDRDYLFKTPSGASSVLLGRKSNGWTEWKDRSGRLLDELVRQDDDSTS